MLRRNTFVTSRALRNFLAASIMTSLSGQLAVTTDAVIVSHMIGPDAISAINMVMPLTMLFSCASILIGLGGSVLAAKAIGKHDSAGVNRIFTVSFLMLLLAGASVSWLSHINYTGIVGAICDNQRIAPLAMDYTKVITAGAFFLILSNGMNYFVTADGSPSLVTKGVVAGTVSNVVLDIILVRQMGIEGSALATVINYIITFGVVSTHFFKKGSSYRLVNPFRDFASHLLRNVYEGLPLMLGNLFLGGAVFIVNSMILSAAGANGVYIWTICLQMLMITFVVLNGVGNAMLSIGGVFVGERDYNGVRILTKLLLMLVCCSLAILVLSVMLFPQLLAFLFGADNAGIDTDAPLRIFSILLIPFAVTLVMRFLFQILEYRMLSLVLSIGQLAGIVLCLWLFTEYAPENLWWSFPASALVLVLLQLGATYLMSRGKRGVSAVTLIPDEESDGVSIDFSVSYDTDAREAAVARLGEFLDSCCAAKEKAARLKECCGSLMQGLAEQTGKRRRCFDLHVRVVKDEIHAVLRDAGKRLNIEKFHERTDGAFEHKYMYGQNVLFLKM